MIKTVTTVDGSEMSVNTQPIQHGTGEMNGFVRQNRQLTVRQAVERFTYSRIKSRTVRHVRPIIGEKHLQRYLNISFGGLVPQSAPDEHECAVADETSDFALGQDWQLELMPDVVDGFGEIVFGVDQRTVEVKYENRPHGPIISQIRIFEISNWTVQFKIRISDLRLSGQLLLFLEADPVFLHEFLHHRIV